MNIFENFFILRQTAKEGMLEMKTWMGTLSEYDHGSAVQFEGPDVKRKYRTFKNVQHKRQTHGDGRELTLQWNGTS